MLQLQDSDMDDDGMDLAFSFRRAFNPIQRRIYSTTRRVVPKQVFQAARYGIGRIPNARLRNYITSSSPYAGIMNDSYNTPTWDRFLYEEGLTGLEDEAELSGRFGNWVRKTSAKAGQGIQKLQKFAAPIIGMLPGGAMVNTAFDIINRPKESPMEPAPMPQPVVTPMLPQMMPQAMPQTMPQMMPAPYEPPQYAGNPYAGFAPPSSGGSINLFGKEIDYKTLALIALGGFIAYKQLKK
jgi:hypothetical protein